MQDLVGWVRTIYERGSEWQYTFNIDIIASRKIITQVTFNQHTQLVAQRFVNYQYKNASPNNQYNIQRLKFIGSSYEHTKKVTQK